MKYDCTKTRECIHEYHRLCDSYPAGCESSCPLFGVDEICGFDIFENEAAIASLQKWSDEHPEKPKIRKEDLAFIKAFKIRDSKYIEMHQGHLRVVTMYGSQEFEIWPSMFPFIEEGQNASFIDMLRMEVEDE